MVETKKLNETCRHKSPKINRQYRRATVRKRFGKRPMHFFLLLSSAMGSWFLFLCHPNKWILSNTETNENKEKRKSVVRSRSLGNCIYLFVDGLLRTVVVAACSVCLFVFFFFLFCLISLHKGIKTQFPQFYFNPFCVHVSLSLSLVHCVWLSSAFCLCSAKIL